MGAVRRPWLLALALAAAATRGAAAQDESAARQLAAELVPAVERAVGLQFRKQPRIEVRSREQVRSYLSRKLVEELPPAEMRAVQRAYRALGIIPDTLDLRKLMLDLYSEQVAGFYDPDSSALFVVRGFDPTVLRLVMGHELVHALQDEYMSLNAILKLKHQNDRQMAGQAVAEGQAMLASLEVMAPGVNLSAVLGEVGDLRQLVGEQLAQQRGNMPVLASAPPIVQESLIFPYIDGLEFMLAFNARRSRPDEEPYGDRLPVSTAQILHPDLYTAHVLPRRVGFGRAPAGDTLVYDDDFGEFETRVALETWGVDTAAATAAAAGWNGDRYEVLGDPGGTVAIWAAAWSSSNDADQFEQAVAEGWSRHTGAPGRPEGAAATGARYGARRWRVDHFAVRGENVVRLVDAPASWAGWARLPDVALARVSR